MSSSWPGNAGQEEVKLLARERISPLGVGGFGSGTHTEVGGGESQAGH